jgi:putative oxidoreductase
VLRVGKFIIRPFGKGLVDRYEEVAMRVGLFVLRLLIGGLFVGHGTQKLFGWFGGGGLDATAASFESLDMRPGRRHAASAGVTETVGGTLLALGLATPLAAASLIGVMTTAIRKVHLQNGVWASGGGYEYNAVLIAALTTLAEEGPGAWSMDSAFGIERKGTRWGLAALACGVLGSAAAIKLGRAEPPRTVPPTTDQEATAAHEVAAART